ncbi:MAG: hypothetical protein HRU06_17655 [Oceanospirillaceae bacterium]|nr:hypothetical protein [Oceanospirillaceae bacterium]
MLRILVILSLVTLYGCAEMLMLGPTNNTYQDMLSHWDGRGIVELVAVYGIPQEKGRMEGFDLLIYKHSEHTVGGSQYCKAVFSVDEDGVVFNASLAAPNAEEIPNIDPCYKLIKTPFLF